jgi:hypothetical protein
MERYWIVGFGVVGRRALDRLRRLKPNAAFSVVDPQVPQTVENGDAVEWVAADGITFLLGRQLAPKGVTSPWIIPALPLHLAYEWMIRRLETHAVVTPCDVPEAAARKLPNPFRGPEGQIFASVADTLCPDNCSEPEKHCPRTGQPRRYALYDHIGTVSTPDWPSVVIRSHQLAPGVGGYRGSQLEAALKSIAARPGPYLLSTASRCHGVMHAFKLQEK